MASIPPQIVEDIVSHCCTVNALLGFPFLDGCRTAGLWLQRLGRLGELAAATHRGKPQRSIPQMMKTFIQGTIKASGKQEVEKRYEPDREGRGLGGSSAAL